MLKRWEFLTLTTIATLAAVLVVANMVLFTSNRSKQVEVNSRVQFVQQSAQLQSLYQEIVKALADLSVKNQDTQLRALLATHGITVTVNPPGQTSAPVAAPAAEVQKKGAR